jgi:hypothetical protein
MTNTTTVGMRPQRTNFNLAQILALTSAALLGGASVLTNVSSAIARHADLSGKVVSGSVALAVAILATVGLAACLQALARKQYAIALLAALTFALSAAFSISSALGVLGGARLQAAMSHEHVEGERTRLEFERRNAVSELAGIASARAADEITPDLSRRLAVPGVDGCLSINGPATRVHCPVIADLQTELARTNKRSALSGLIAQHDRDLASLGVPAIANKDAVAVAHVLAAIGVKVSADAINTGLMILGVLILECGGALSLATASALRAVTVSPIIDATPIAHVALVPAVVAPTSSTIVPRARAKAEAAIMKALASGDEQLPASVRKLHARVGVASRATVHTAVVSLLAAGAIVKVGNVIRAAT